MTLAVVYLARAAEGPAPIEKFAASYSRFPAGADHTLIVVCKGEEAADLARPHFPDDAIVFPISDDGVDVTAYLHAARSIDHKRLIFLNTFSEILHPDWLAKIDAAFKQESVGLVGATASRESLRDTVELIERIIYSCAVGLPYDPLLAEEWGHEIIKRVPRWFDQSSFYWIRTFIRRRHPLRWKAKFEDNFARYWSKVIGPGGVYEFVRDFPRFPNAHIRSNGFMIDRKLLLSISPEVNSKLDAYEFESGVNSLSSRITSLGLECLVVGADGRPYRSQEWRESSTFRSNNQRNLLIADNQTRAYDALPLRAKLRHELMTWGTA
jgi:hypothetical protein